jgi:hypothetical protein
MLTKQFVEGSARFAMLSPTVKTRGDLLATALCEHLANLAKALTPAQKAHVVAAYQAGVSALEAISQMAFLFSFSWFRAFVVS